MAVFAGEVTTLSGAPALNCVAANGGLISGLYWKDYARRIGAQLGGAAIRKLRVPNTAGSQVRLADDPTIASTAAPIAGNPAPKLGVDNPGNKPVAPATITVIGAVWPPGTAANYRVLLNGVQSATGAATVTDTTVTVPGLVLATAGRYQIALNATNGAGTGNVLSPAFTVG